MFQHLKVSLVIRPHRAKKVFHSERRKFFIFTLVEMVFHLYLSREKEVHSHVVLRCLCAVDRTLKCKH